MKTFDGVSVVIPVYGRTEILGYTLEGLARQRDQDFEVCLVDQGGSIDFSALLHTFGPHLSLHYLNLPASTSVGAKRNGGVDQSIGNLLIFLDSDVIPGPEFVAAHRAAHAHGDPLAGIGYIYALKGFERSALPALLLEASYDALMARFKQIRTSIPDERDAYYAKVNDDVMAFRAPWNVFWGGNVSVTRTAFTRVGGFDRHFRGWGYEDVEFGYRLYRSGLRLGLVRTAWGLHYPQAVDVAPRVGQADDNLRYFVQKYPYLDAELYAYYLEPWTHYRPHFDRLTKATLEPEDIDWIEQQGWLYGSRIALLGYEPLLATYPQITTVMEPRPGVYQGLSPGPAAAVHLSGLYCPWPADSFDVVLVTSLWIQYDAAQQRRLAFEFLRLAPRVVFLSSQGDVPLDALQPERGPNDLGTTGQDGPWTAQESMSHRIRAIQLERLQHEDL